MPDGIDLRCSAVVVRQGAVLLIHRTSGADHWTLPGGTPRPGESMAACARREVREETSLNVDPARVAFVLEVIGTLSGRNRIAAAFYDGPGWPRFQPWERLFLWFQGPGLARARRRVH